MMPQARWVGFDDHEVEAKAEWWQLTAVRERAGRDHRPRGVADVATLAEVDGLLRETERPARPEPDLDDHESRRRAGVDGDEIDLVSADANVPAEDRPALELEAIRDEAFGIVPSELRGGPASAVRMSVHRGSVAGVANLSLIPRPALSAALVAQIRRARGEFVLVDEAEPERLGERWEVRLAATEDDRMDDQPVLIHEVPLDELRC